MQYITYLRVSTAQQGSSGLGVEAQRAAVTAFTRDGEILAEYVEVESGKRNDRPQLASALAHAKRAKARLVIAKLDRLARNVAFIANMMESKVDFVACDMPTANKLMLHIMAAFAEAERDMISARTKAALEAAKARGVQLGCPDRHAGARATAAAAAERHAAARQLAAEARAEGRTLVEICGLLAAKGLRTTRGGEWTPTQARRLINI